jgi:hypothetical protein
VATRRLTRALRSQKLRGGGRRNRAPHPGVVAGKLWCSRLQNLFGTLRRATPQTNTLGANVEMGPGHEARDDV